MRAHRYVLCAGALAMGCASTFPPPTQSLTDAESARRTAEEIGASRDPSARLHAQLAEEQIAKARNMMKDGDNKAADLMLMRAKADAELALELAREQTAKAALEDAVQKADAARAMTGPQGAQQ